MTKSVIISEMRIRHTVIFTFYESTTENQIIDVISRLNTMGDSLVKELGVTNWTVARHIPDTYKTNRAHLLQDCIFPNLDALNAHASSDGHKHVVELTPHVSDWMTVDTEVA